MDVKHHCKDQKSYLEGCLHLLARVEIQNNTVHPEDSDKFQESKELQEVILSSREVIQRDSGENVDNKC